MRTLLLSTTMAAFATTAAAFTPPSTDLTNTPSGTYVLDKSHANIVFGVSHLGFSQYFSRFNGFDATLDFNAKNPEKSTLSVTIDTSSADANNAKMEKKYDSDTFFNVKQYPTATFKSTSITKLTDNTGTITGDLTLLGVTKPVTLDVIFNGSGKNPYAGADALGFSAEGILKRSEFGMDQYLPAVGDEVRLNIQAEFLHKSTPKE